MKNVLLVAGLSAVLAGAAMADTGKTNVTAPVLNYSRPVNSPAKTDVTTAGLNEWGWSYYYDIRSRDSAIVITKPIFTATNLFGARGLNMSVEGFGGVGLETGKLIGGVAGLFKGKVADQIWIGVGPGLTVQDGKPLGFGVLGQISIKF